MDGGTYPAQRGAVKWGLQPTGPRVPNNSNKEKVSWLDKTHLMKQFMNSVDCCKVIYTRPRLLTFYLLNS